VHTPLTRTHGTPQWHVHSAHTTDTYTVHTPLTRTQCTHHWHVHSAHHWHVHRAHTNDLIRCTYLCIFISAWRMPVYFCWPGSWLCDRVDEERFWQHKQSLLWCLTRYAVDEKSFWQHELSTAFGSISYQQLSAAINNFQQLSTAFDSISYQQLSAAINSSWQHKLSTTFSSYQQLLTAWAINSYQQLLTAWAIDSYQQPLTAINSISCRCFGVGTIVPKGLGSLLLGIWTKVGNRLQGVLKGLRVFQKLVDSELWNSEVQSQFLSQVTPKCKNCFTRHAVANNKEVFIQDNKNT